VSKLDARGSRERRRTVCHVKYLVNKREPEALEFATRLAAAGIDYSTLPTSGPTTLVVDGIASYGQDAIRYAVDYVIGQHQRQAGRVGPLARSG